MSTLTGKTMVVLGYGSIGRECARLAKTAFKMNIIGVKRSPGSDDEYASRIYTTGELDEALPQADFLLAVLPSLPDTRQILNARAFSLMKPSSVIINIGRGDSIEEADLIAALESG